MEGFHIGISMADKQKLRQVQESRTITSLARLAESLGADAGRFFKYARSVDTITGCPYFIYSLSQDKDGYHLKYIGERYESDGIDLTETLNRFGTNVPNDYGLIGYDIEYESGALLSHQLAFWVSGIRFALVISTDLTTSISNADLRFSDSFFIGLLEQIVKRVTEITVKHWYVFAHFSIIEGSWLDSRESVQMKFRSANSWKNERRIRRDRKQWLGTVDLIRQERLTRKGTSYKTPKFDKVHLHFGDTMNLYASSLAAVAADLGFKKGDPGGDISKMSEVKKERFEEFCRYGVRDAILCTAIALDIHSRFAGLGLDFRARTAAFSETFFRDFFKEHYSTYGGDWRRYLGQVQGYSDDKPYKHWMPGRLQHRCLNEWYHGGRNDVHRVGCFGEAYYHDLTSAYPTALIMMLSDYDFGRSHHYWGDEAKREISRLRELGPYQPHAVTVYCRFRSDVIPIFPASVEGSVIFPQIFHGTVTWPEYWTALELDLLEECTVIELIAFEALSGRFLPEKAGELLKNRKTDEKNKLLYKNLLNFHYGKCVQGCSGKVPFSSISCPALGAYITGFCRASVGELANLNKDYYAITTDGFISPHEVLTTGNFNAPIIERLKGIGFDWIGIDAKGTDSFFIKTRGYALWNSKTGEGKFAAMGVQARGDISSFIDQVRAGTGTKTSWRSFCSSPKEIEAEEKRRANAVKRKQPIKPGKLLPGEIASQRVETYTIDTTFDMKFMPLPDTIDVTGTPIDNDFLALTSFETRPLRDVYEYEHLRCLARFKNSKKFEELERRGLSASEIAELLTAHALEHPQTRRLLWRIRNGIVKHLKREETVLTEKQWAAYERCRAFSLELSNESLKESRWLFRHELECVKDKKRRRALSRTLFQEIQATLSQKAKSLVTGTA